MKICPACHRCYEDEDASCEEAGHPPLEGARHGRRLIAERYRLDRFNNRGPVSIVYRGTDVTADTPVAVKLLPPEYAGRDSGGLERFSREGAVAALIEHPNVVRVYSHGRLEYGEAYIAMEFLEGPTLREVMKKAGALPTRIAVSVMLQVAEGVAAAHAKGVLHRDLKPENVMFTGDPSDGSEAKVIDFGLAKFRPALTTVSYDSLTPAGWFIGSVQYTSPENCRGLRLDARADVYSLGIILYEMLAGRRPFLETTIIGLCRQHVEDVPPFIGALRPNIPPRLTALVMQALNKAPESRPQDAREFAERLREVAQSIPQADLQTPQLLSGDGQPQIQRPLGATDSPQLEHLEALLGGPPKVLSPLPRPAKVPRLMNSITLSKSALAVVAVMFLTIVGALLILVLLLWSLA